MKEPAQLEYWLRGPVPGIPPLLQPVAHALLQARDEVNVLMDGFPGEKLWDRPAGVASVGFHLRHLTGVLDRLFTYARGEALDRQQLDYLAAEGVPGGEPGGSGSGEGIGSGDGVGVLLQRFNQQIDKALEELGRVAEDILTAPREVGRGRIPSTAGGLLFHAAEHTQRHTGQLLVTVRILRQPL